MIYYLFCLFAYMTFEEIIIHGQILHKDSQKKDAVSVRAAIIFVNRRIHVAAWLQTQEWRWIPTRSMSRCALAWGF
jgi:hypothetical protein